MHHRPSRVSGNAISQDLEIFTKIKDSIVSRGRILHTFPLSVLFIIRLVTKTPLATQNTTEDSNHSEPDRLFIETRYRGKIWGQLPKTRNCNIVKVEYIDLDWFMSKTRLLRTTYFSSIIKKWRLLSYRWYNKDVPSGLINIDATTFSILTLKC